MSYNILLVDDSNVVKAVLIRILSQSSLPIKKIFDAANGADALEALEENLIDLVIADINMPVMDGVELVERMRADESMERIPVVVISTEGSSTRIDHLRDLGISAYIRKPFSADEIKTVFEQILGES